MQCAHKGSCQLGIVSFHSTTAGSVAWNPGPEGSGGTSVPSKGSTWQRLLILEGENRGHMHRCLLQPCAKVESTLYKAMSTGSSTCGADILRLPAAAQMHVPHATHKGGGHSGHYQSLTTSGVFIRRRKPQHLNSCSGSLTDERFRTYRHEKTKYL